MLTFKEYIKEAFHTGLKTKDGMVEIYKNPTRSELKDSTSEYNDTRAVIHGGDIYTWNSEDALHHRVSLMTGIKGTNAMIDHKDKRIMLDVDPVEKDKASEYTNSDHFKKHFHDYTVET
jgi:hypothetical protein